MYHLIKVVINSNAMLSFTELNILPQGRKFIGVKFDTNNACISKYGRGGVDQRLLDSYTRSLPAPNCVIREKKRKKSKKQKQTNKQVGGDSREWFGERKSHLLGSRMGHHFFFDQ